MLSNLSPLAVFNSQLPRHRSQDHLARRQAFSHHYLYLDLRDVDAGAEPSCRHTPRIAIAAAVIAADTVLPFAPQVTEELALLVVIRQALVAEAPALNLIAVSCERIHPCRQFARDRLDGPCLLAKGRPAPVPQRDHLGARYLRLPPRPSLRGLGQVAEEAAMQLVCGGDERKFHVPVAVVLTQSRFVSVA